MKCMNCDNTEEFSRMWNKAFVYVKLDYRGEWTGEPEIGELYDKDSVIVCEHCDSNQVEED